MTLRLLAVCLVALAVPAVSEAGIATAITREVPFGTPGKPAAADTPTPFHLVGLAWRGQGTVEFRVRSASGGWDRWRSASPEPEDRPDAGSQEARGGSRWRAGNPWWVGPAIRLQVRARGKVTAVRATYVRSPELRIPLRALSAAGAPPIVPRSAWGADESIRRAEPEIASELRYAVVHHTAGSNDYTPGEVAAILRGIQLYHVRGNGWNDIGYNFLVDRFGIIYEGRFGGIDQNIVGAHAQGFNTGSVGVAVLGTYEGEGIPAAAETALANLLAWRLDLAHVDPLATLNVVSNGNARFPAGLPVFLRAVSGHRDTGFTACPGQNLYDTLGAIATRAAETGLPKLYEPLAVGSLGGPVRITGRLSGPTPWTVRITDPAGVEVTSGTGIGPAVDWTWDSTAAPPGPYAWAIDGGPEVTGASGAVTGGFTPGGLLAFTGTAADPETITPNGDGQTDAASIVYTINANANVSADVVDASGQVVAPLEPPRWRRAGEHVISFDGLALPDGLYAVQLVARAAGGIEASADVPVGITRTLSQAALAPSLFSPNADRRGDKLAVSLALTRAATVTLRIVRDGRWIATPFEGPLLAGRRRIVWDGRKRLGRLRDGVYTAVVETVDTVGTTRLELPFSSDTTPPRVRLLSPQPPQLDVREPARLTMRINGARRLLEVTTPGSVPIPGVAGVRTLVLVARDAAGNVTRLKLAPGR